MRAFSNAISPFGFGEYMPVQISDLKVIPSPTSSEKDFDFLEGHWKVKNRKLVTLKNQSKHWIEFDATHVMTKNLNGMGNYDINHYTLDEEPIEEMCLRLFDPRTKHWRTYCTDSVTAKIQASFIGSFKDNEGLFFASEYSGAKKMLIKNVWARVNSATPTWNSAVSHNNGQSWELNWMRHYSRP